MNCLLLCNQNKRSRYRNRTYLRATLIKDYLYIKDFAKLLQRDKEKEKKKHLFLAVHFSYLFAGAGLVQEGR